MTLVLSADQLTDMQGDIGLTTDPLDASYGKVFSDTELNRFYNRAVGVFYKAEVLAFRQLLADAAKWVNYTEGQTQEERSDRFKQVQQVLAYTETTVLQGTNGQYRMVHIRPVPTPCRDRPYDRYGSYGGYGANGWGRKCCGGY